MMEKEVSIIIIIQIVVNRTFIDNGNNDNNGGNSNNNDNRLETVWSLPYSIFLLSKTVATEKANLLACLSSQLQRGRIWLWGFEELKIMLEKIYISFQYTECQ